MAVLSRVNQSTGNIEVVWYNDPNLPQSVGVFNIGDTGINVTFSDSPNPVSLRPGEQVVKNPPTITFVVFNKDAAYIEGWEVIAVRSGEPITLEVR